MIELKKKLKMQERKKQVKTEEGSILLSLARQMWRSHRSKEKEMKEEKRKL